LPAQAEVAAALLDPGRAAPAGLAPADRLAVYRNNVVAGLIEALAAAYPAVCTLVGRRFFDGMAGAFVRRQPPRSPVLIGYGERFPAFVGAFEPVQRVPFLADVALLERAWLEAYHAAEAAPLSIDAMAALPETALAATVLRLHPSARLLRSRWPVASLWAANTGRASHASVDLDRAEQVLVIRPDDTVQVHVLSAATAELLAALVAGRPLGAAAAAWRGDAAAIDLGAVLGQLFALGAVTAFATAPSGSSA
jgi:hypothetical protein